MANAFQKTYARTTPLVVKGVDGRIQWSYCVAATVQVYTAVRSVKGVWTVRAKLVQPDRFKLRQTPLVFVAQHAKGIWLWQVQDSHCDDTDTFRATLLGEPIAETNPQGGIHRIQPAVKDVTHGHTDAPPGYGAA